MGTHGLQTYFFLALLLGAGALAFFMAVPFMGPLVLAAAFASLVHPVYEALVARLRLPALSALITMILGLLIVALPLSLLGMQLVSEAQNLYTRLSDGGSLLYVGDAVQNLGGLADRVSPGASAYLPHISGDIDIYAKQGLAWLLSHFGVAFAGVGRFVLSFLIFLVAFFYLLRDGASLKRALIKLSPLADRDDQSLFDRLALSVSSVVRGNFVVAIAQGVLAGIGYAIFGVPNAVLWGTVTGVAALIPGIGTSLVLVPVIGFLFLSGDTFSAVGMLLWGTVLVGLIDNFLAPIVVGRGMQLHPLIVFIAVLGGLAFFGPIGVLLGPLTFSFLLALLSMYSTSSQSV